MSLHYYSRKIIVILVFCAFILFANSADADESHQQLNSPISQQTPPKKSLQTVIALVGDINQAGLSRLEAQSTNRESKNGEQTPFEVLRLRINALLCSVTLYQRKKLRYKIIINNYSQEV